VTRLLYVQRDRLRFPLDDATRAKWDALSAAFDVRVVAGQAEGEPDSRFAVAKLRGGAAFYASLPLRVARELHAFRPDLVIAQSAYEAAAVLALRPKAPVVVDVHGDWRTATRAYGSPARRLAAPLADRVAGWALRRADGVRTVSPFASRLVRALGREPAAEFPAYADLRAFRGAPAPLPETPAALYVGALEPVKGVRELAEAWPQVGGRLVAVGDGSLAPLLDGLAERHAGLDRAGVAAALDDAWCLVLPSATEGFGRVVVEAFLRGRAVVGSRAGAIPDLVEDGVSGLLVDPGDARALAEALRRLLSDRALAERLGVGAHAASSRWALDAEEHVARTRELVERVLA
jgi:glycosyltransferase involved in cell wall biosynthesis